MLIVTNLLSGSEYLLRGDPHAIEGQLRSILGHALDIIPKGDMHGMLRRINNMTYWAAEEKPD